MNVVLRVAVQEDYEAVSALYAQLVRVHAQALPQFFHPAESPALSQKVFAEMIARRSGMVYLQRLPSWLYCSSLGNSS